MKKLLFLLLFCISLTGCDLTHTDTLLTSEEKDKSRVEICHVIWTYKTTCYYTKDGEYNCYRVRDKIKTVCVQCYNCPPG